MGLILSNTIKALARASAEKYITECNAGLENPQGLCHESVAHTLHLAYNVGYEEALGLLYNEYINQLNEKRQ